MTTLVASSVLPRWPLLRERYTEYAQERASRSVGWWHTRYVRTEVMDFSRAQARTVAHTARGVRSEFLGATYGAWTPAMWVNGPLRDPDESITWSWHMTERGAPFRCFYGTAVLGVTDEGRVGERHGVLEVMRGTEAQDAWLVSLIPIWPGLAGNVAVYGVGSWALVGAVRLGTRRARRARAEGEAAGAGGAGV